MDLSKLFVDCFLPKSWKFEDGVRIHHIVNIDNIFDIRFDFDEFRIATFIRLFAESVRRNKNGN